MQNITDKLIVALDVDTVEKVGHFVNILYPTVKFFKVGSPLFTACGPEVIRVIGDKGAKVFLDLKFYDIPNTVYLSASSGTASAVYFQPSQNNIEKTKSDIKNKLQPPVFMMTVHTQGGKEMLEAALKGAREKAEELKINRPYVVGVTVLTSENGSNNIEDTVLQRARLAYDTGLDGVVCGVSEAVMVRKEFGEKFLIVTPGIRPKGVEKGDQKRTATASEAIKAGSDFLVVGRPILEADNPLKAVKELV